MVALCPAQDCAVIDSGQDLGAAAAHSLCRSSRTALLTFFGKYNKESEKFGVYDLPYQGLLDPTEKVTHPAPDALAEEVKRAKFS
jgi:hypothetical protein